jgi:Domain of unknown function (DUF4062)/GAF domain
MERKFSIFLSSTKRDLERERKIFIDYIFNSGNILVGMELFTAGYERTWDIVEKRLKRSDGLILIVGGRYGSLVDDEDISFTEKEFIWAQENKLPVIVFMLSESAIAGLPHENVDQTNKERRKSREFRAKLKGKFVNTWTGLEDLQSRAGIALPTWQKDILEKQSYLGWCRSYEAEQLNIELDVYRYLINALTPESRNITINRPILKNLTVNFSKHQQLRRSANYLISDYAAPRATQISTGIRIYFAYRLSEERQRNTRNGAYLYQISISNSDEKDWITGCLVDENSNIHTVFSEGEKSIINDVEDRNNYRRNAKVDNELSVINEPIYYDNEVVAVLGLSSPRKDEFRNEILLNLADELATILSALMFAYGAYKCRNIRIDDIEERAKLIRNEISQSFSDLSIDNNTLTAGS